MAKKHPMITTLPPLHPGEVLRDEFLVPMNLSAYAVAKACGIPRTRIERIVREEGQLDGAAIQRFTPRPYHGHMTLFRCSEQSPWLKDESTLGWQPYAAGGIEVIPIPGHHGNLVLEPGVRTLAARLRECMNKLIQADAPKV